MGMTDIAGLPRGAGETILLVDDDAAGLHCTGEILRRLGYVVTAVARGDVALALLRGGRSFRLVVTDYRMSCMDGLKLVHMARTAGIRVPMILSTGYGDLETYLTTNEYDNLYFIAKPFGVRDIGALARKALARGIEAGDS